MVVNVKAQASRIFSGIKEAPIAKGIKDVFYVDGLFKDAQKKALSELNDGAKRGIRIGGIDLEDVNVGGVTAGKATNSSKQALKEKLSQVDKSGLESIKDEQLKDFIDKRAAKNPNIADLQKETILNVAKDNIMLGNHPSTESIADLITKSAREVDGQLTVMTPFNAAKEYYGTPLTGVIDNLQMSDFNGALKDAVVLGGRVTASAFAVGGTTAVVGGTANLVRAGVNRIKGNSYER